MSGRPGGRGWDDGRGNSRPRFEDRRGGRGGPPRGPLRFSGGKRPSIAPINREKVRNNCSGVVTITPHSTHRACLLLLVHVHTHIILHCTTNRPALHCYEYSLKSVDTTLPKILNNSPTHTQTRFISTHGETPLYVNYATSSNNTTNMHVNRPPNFPFLWSILVRMEAVSCDLWDRCTPPKMDLMIHAH